MGQQNPLTWIWFDLRRVYRCCVSSNGVSTRQSGRNAFRTPGKCRRMVSRRCVCGCGESLGEVRADKEGIVAKGIYLVLQPAERSSTFRIRALVGTGEDLVLKLRRRGSAHWGGSGGGSDGEVGADGTGVGNERVLFKSKCGDVFWIELAGPGMKEGYHREGSSGREREN